MDSTISLCMIVRDEEAFLASCLAAVRDVVSQIVCVDTGSVDGTVEIAREYGAEVYSHPWNNDFAAARNISLSYATGDFILVLDADEIICQEDLSHLLAHVRTPNTAYLMMQRHYSNDARLSGFVPCQGMHPQFEKHYTGYFESGLVRLFPNNRGIEYRGRVHELVEHSIEEIDGISIEHSPVILHHYGHTPEVKEKKNKGSLYTPLGEAKVQELHEDWKSYFELGVEHNNNGNALASISAFEKSLALNPGYLSTWVNFGYVLCEAEQYDRARRALHRAIAMQADCEEAYCNLGVVELRCESYVPAERYFAKALEIRPLYVNAARNLALAIIYQNRIADAVLVLREFLKLVPAEPSVSGMLGELYLRSGKVDKLERLLVPVIARNPTDLKALQILTLCCREVRGAADAVRFLMRHERLHQENLSESARLALRQCIDREMIAYFLS